MALLKQDKIKIVVDDGTTIYLKGKSSWDLLEPIKVQLRLLKRKYICYSNLNSRRLKRLYVIDDLINPFDNIK